MNDFTKEELVQLWRCINPILIGDNAYDLKIKLRDMIDKYSENDKDRTTHPVDFMNGKVKCSKCEAVYDNQ